MVLTESEIQEPIISDSVSKITLFTRHVDPGYIQEELNRQFSGKCYNGTYVLKDSIRILNVMPAVTRRIVDPYNPFRVTIVYKYREFMPIVGKVYNAVVNKIDAKGTILRYIIPESGESAMVITVIDRYMGNEGDRVPVHIIHKFTKNGRSEISSIGEFADAIDHE